MGHVNKFPARSLCNNKKRSSFEYCVVAIAIISVSPYKVLSPRVCSCVGMVPVMEFPLKFLQKKKEERRTKKKMSEREFQRFPLGKNNFIPFLSLF